MKQTDTFTCHMCNKKIPKMIISTQDKIKEKNHNLYFYVCQNLSCANYALVQIPVELMP